MESSRRIQKIDVSKFRKIIFFLRRIVTVNPKFEYFWSHRGKDIGTQKIKFWKFHTSSKNFQDNPIATITTFIIWYLYYLGQSWTILLPYGGRYSIKIKIMLFQVPVVRFKFGKNVQLYFHNRKFVEKFQKNPPTNNPSKMSCVFEKYTALLVFCKVAVLMPGRRTCWCVKILIYVMKIFGSVFFFDNITFEVNNFCT